MLKDIFQNADSHQKKLLTKRLIALCFSLFACILALLISADMSFGWFSKNLNTDSNGMTLKADIFGNIVISGDEDDISNPDISIINDGNPFLFKSESGNTRYSPAVHDDSSETGLSYVINTDTIDFYTGAEKSGGVFSYANAGNGEKKHYYTDYTVYIASHGKAVEDATLTVSISSATKEVDGSEVNIESGSLMATSVDVYAGSVSPENYKGTLNVAGLDREYNDYPETYSPEKTLTSIYLVGGEDSTGEIPLNTEGHLTYILRCYFDGALLCANNKTYIYSAVLDTSKVTLNIKFTATGNDA